MKENNSVRDEIFISHSKVDKLFLENLIEREKNPELKKVIEDLDDFLFPY